MRVFAPIGKLLNEIQNRQFSFVLNYLFILKTKHRVLFTSYQLCHHAYENITHHAEDKKWKNFSQSIAYNCIVLHSLSAGSGIKEQEVCATGGAWKSLPEAC